MSIPFLIVWLLSSAAIAVTVWFVAVPAPTRQDIQMVRVEAGPFTMGSASGPADEQPEHVVELAAFEIDRLPVTNAQFAAFLNEQGTRNSAGQNLYDADDADARIDQVDGRFAARPGFEHHPVVEPSWLGARDFCRWRGARLPTEAEWERAARGTDARIYPWGNDPPDPSRAKYAARMNDYLPVASFPASESPVGALDMAGNVWNWVSSLYRPYPYRPDDGREDPDDPGERVTRGGGHSTSAETLRSAHRGRGLSRAPAAGHHNIGFRCARDAA